MKDVVTWRTKLSNPPDALRIYHTCMDALTHLCKYLSLEIYIYNYLRQSRSVYIYILCIYVELQDARAGSGSSILTTSTRRHCCSSASHHPVHSHYLFAYMENRNTHGDRSQGIYVFAHWSHMCISQSLRCWLVLMSIEPSQFEKLRIASFSPSRSYTLLVIACLWNLMVT